LPAKLDNYKQGDIQSLDWLTEDSTVDEILALDCLEYLPEKKVRSTIENWASKLSTGGVIKILVPDCHLAAKSFHQGQFSLQEYQTIVFGTQEHGDNRLSIIDSTTLVGILKDCGLTISLRRYEGVAFYLEAVK
jgi:predicted SAM-dependent methyltransferase